jgi:hypothetical protein
MARLQQIGCHADAHSSKSNKSYVHRFALVASSRLIERIWLFGRFLACDTLLFGSEFC